jgi:hypothetical protein
MGSSQGRPDKGASSAAASSSTSEDQPSPRSRLYDPHDNSSFMSGWLLLRPPGKRKARAMWCLVKDGMIHEFKRAESRKPHASRRLEGSLAMPIENAKQSTCQRRGFQLVLGGLYGSEKQESIEYELVDGRDEDVEKWLNSISAASLLAAIASNGGMPQYAVDALAVSEQTAARRERRTRAVVGKAAQSWDGCSVSSSAKSTASTVSAFSQSSSSSEIHSHHQHITMQSRVAEGKCDASSDPLPHPSPPSVTPKDAQSHHSQPPPPPIPCPLPPASVRHFRRRAPGSIRLVQPAAPQQICTGLSPPVFATQSKEEAGEFDV